MSHALLTQVVDIQTNQLFLPQLYFTRFVIPPVEQYISIWELISLQLFLGSIIYIVGCIVLFFVLRKEVNRKYKIALLLLVQFCISVLLSLIIWQSWNIDIDIMALEFINLPALFSEFVTIPICYFILKNGKNKKIASF